MPKILLVDDEPGERYLMFFALSEYDCQILEAGDGEEGFKIALESKPDLIITDHMMPRLSGYEMIQRMRSNPILQDVPIIMLTAKHFDKEFPELLQLQGCRFVGKPLHRDVLLINIEKVLGPLHPKPWK